MNSTTEKPLPPTRFVAFYSYKGGVGRTLALTNCARAMTAGGKRVVLLDFDLEAPGLHHFPTLKPKQEKAAGFVEYLQACLDGNTPPSLEDYVHACPGQTEDQGQAWIMPAGRHDDPAYLELLNQMNWAGFYTEQAGYQILENLRGHLIAQFQPDYVLMDARTGLSEIGGIATHQLADIVVLLFNLNEQNLHGAQRVFQSVKHSPMQPKIILVASPVPTVPSGKGTPFYERMQYIRKHFTGAENTHKPLVIPYNPLLAFGESLFVDEHDDPFSSEEPYLQLLDLIKQAAGVDADTYLEQAISYWRKFDATNARNYLEEGLANNPNSPTLWYHLGIVLNAINEPEKAIDAFSQVINVGTTSNLPELQVLIAKALVTQGAIYGQIGKIEDELTAYDTVISRYGQNHNPELQARVAKALVNQCAVLGQLGNYEEALASCHRVLDTFGSCTKPEIQELIARALFNQGVAFDQIDKPQEALAAYEQIVSKFGTSNRIEMKELVASALEAQGILLNKLGCFHEAIGAYSKIIRYYKSNDRPELQKKVAQASVRQCHSLICLAKKAKSAGDASAFEKYLISAEKALQKAEHIKQNDHLWLENGAYLLHLQNQTGPAAVLLRGAMELGGKDVFRWCKDAISHNPLPEDKDFIVLVDELAEELFPS